MTHLVTEADILAAHAIAARMPECATLLLAQAYRLGHQSMVGHQELMLLAAPGCVVLMPSPCIGRAEQLKAAIALLQEELRLHGEDN